MARLEQSSKIVLLILLSWYILFPILNNVGVGNIAGINLDLSRVYGFTIVGLVTLLFVLRSIGRAPMPIVFWVIIFNLYMFGHVFLSGATSQGMSDFIRAFGGFIILLFFLQDQSISTAARMRKFLIAISVITAIYVIVQSLLYKLDQSLAYDLFGRDQFWGADGQEVVRPRGLLESAGGSASAITIGIVLYLKNWMTRRLKSIEFLMLGILCTGLLFNFTRTFVFLLLVFTLLIMTRPGHYRRFVAFSVIMIVVATAYIAFVGWERVATRFADIPVFTAQPQDRDVLLKGRLELTDMAVAQFSQLSWIEKIVGMGMGWSAHALNEAYKAEYGRQFSATSTHNDFLWLVMNLGFVGLSIYLVLISTTIMTYKGPDARFFVWYVILFLIVAGIGGESIPITGHRYLQMIALAYLYNEERFAQR